MMINIILKDIQNIYKIMQLVRRYKKFLFIEILLKNIIESALPFLSYLLSARIINSIVKQFNIITVINEAILGCFGLFIISFFIRLINRHINLMQKDLNYIMKEDISKRARTMNYSKLIDYRTMERLTKATEGSVNYGGIVMFSSTIGELIKNLFLTLYSFIVLISLFVIFQPHIKNKELVQFYILIFLAAIFLINICFNMMNKRLNYLNYEQNVRYSNKLNYFKSLLTNRSLAGDIRVFNVSDLIVNKIKNILESYILHYKKINKQIGNSEGLLQAFNQIISFFIYIYIAYISYETSIKPGSVITICGAIKQLLNASNGLCAEFVDLTMHTNYLLNYCSFFDDIDIDNNQEKNVSLQDVLKKNDFELCFNNVCFKYPNSNVYALKNLSFKISKGEKVALVGRNGSGKSTIVALICKYYVPSSGEITLNGIDIQKIENEEYWKILSVTFQDFKLFSFDIKNNITSDLLFNEKRAKDYLDYLNFMNDENNNTLNFSTLIGKDFGDGINLSKGEEQKVAISRAMYKNSKLMIFDEPSSSLDAFSEMLLYEKLNGISCDKTVIYISHRMSSCRFCDNIIVLNEGILVQEGHHASLVKEEGVYRDLWIKQSKLYKYKDI